MKFQNALSKKYFYYSLFYAKYPTPAVDFGGCWTGSGGGCLAHGKLFFFKYVVISKKLRFKSPKYRKLKSAKNGMGVPSSNKAERQISEGVKWPK